jgi:predicted enzyme related to lactoylglutathione lyase
MTERPHYFGHGRLAYIQIPATDTQASADFYARVFGWQIRGTGTAHLSFTDTTGDMIGAWVTNRRSASEPGIVPYIYVRGLDDALARIVEAGCGIVEPPYLEGDVWVATFRDPAGNVIGVWQRDPR